MEAPADACRCWRGLRPRGRLSFSQDLGPSMLPFFKSYGGDFTSSRSKATKPRVC